MVLFSFLLKSRLLAYSLFQCVFVKGDLKMNQKAIFKFCKDLGCCDGCSLRYLGIRSPAAYENIKKYCLKFIHKPDDTVDKPTQPETTSDPTPSEVLTNKVDEKTPDLTHDTNGTAPDDNGQTSNGNGTPPMKRRRADVCVTCLGVLQEDGWLDCNSMVKEILDKKKYDCPSFACALSAPIATILREKAICLRLKDAYEDYDLNTITALKEAWKWSYGTQLANYLKISLDSGAVSPLLITLNMEYPDDLQELEILKSLSPELFQSRSRQRKRFAVEFTRRSVEQALEGATLEAMKALDGWSEGMPPPGASVACVSVVCTRTPLYLGGRYIKLSRTLPQTPWLVAGKRMMESSVQEIIFEPLAKAHEMSEADAEHRLKFMSAGREDVDVRCLGDGRPFAVEITDPRRELTTDELRQVCELVSSGGQVVLKQLVYVTKEDLTLLKTGEETKCKTYEALCIKITHSQREDGKLNGSTPIEVTDDDITRINSYRNTPPDADALVLITQKTPIRVLHRRPLIDRTRQILEMKAAKVPDHPRLFVLQIRTSAGAYVKEFVHGELGRTTPSLEACGAGRADILALDVSQVHLNWPNIQQ